MGIDPQKVLDVFVSDGRLTSIPARAGKRRVILEHIVTTFEPGIRYTEREVDATLRAWYAEDWVSLRRYLIDEGWQLLSGRSSLVLNSGL